MNNLNIFIITAKALEEFQNILTDYLPDINWRRVALAIVLFLAIYNRTNHWYFSFFALLGLEFLFLYESKQTINNFEINPNFYFNDRKLEFEKNQDEENENQNEILKP